MGSKFLFRSESVRDVVDLKLSKKHMSPVNVMDTACTASAHLITRDPELAKTIFNERRGSWVKPVRDKPPSSESIPELEPQDQKSHTTSLPHESDLRPHEHPLTRKTDKYFCGDRFHEKRFPHRSELCRYHNINLVPQLKTAKTSEQENVNSIRNTHRLRSTCTQKLGTHLFYNAVVMDRAHNRGIVRKQGEELNKDVSKRHLEWLHVV